MRKKASVQLEWENKNKLININSYKNIEEIARVYPFSPQSSTVNFNQLLENNKPLNGRLIQGENLEVMKNLLNTGYKEKFDLIYLDPPYFSDSNYKSKIKVGNKDDRQVITRNVFHDSWKDLDAYLDYIFPILLLSKELLSERGNLFVHLDWHACHYIKVILDEIFSRDCFINEIIWCYGGGSGAKRHFHRKHDMILWYSKSDKYIFNPQYRPYTEKTRDRGLTKVKGPKYVLNEQGALMQDWWTDINKILSPTAYENLKFPTQKPMPLLERIIKAGSEENSLIGDFFGGSGTTAEAAENLNRNWIVCDNSNIAIQTTHNRLINCNAQPYTIETTNSQYHENDLNVICKYNGENIIINLESHELTNFWEIGIKAGNVFKSFIQIVRPNSKSNDLPNQVVLKDINLNEKVSIIIKAYDFLGNIIIKEQPL